MSRPGNSPRRSPREPRRRRREGGSKDDDDNYSSPVAPSPGSWNVDRGRSRVRRPSNPFSEDSLRRRGYHTIVSSFQKVFHLERRWKLVRELGSGAYGVVISAEDEISGETVAIKLVTRVFEKIQFAKRALREITLLRHFSHHGNITGLIDVDAISPEFTEIYIFMEPMEADLHQIIRSGQTLTNEHVQYFTYQILRGMKYIHSAGVIHRDLKPGNLLVNADCELKICDFGLSRGYDAAPDENASHLTEYVATRWYRAPEIMLAYRKYDTAIDVWSIGCILAELLMGAPLFKGKDYVDQLNKIFAVLGTPNDEVIRKIGSPKAQAYVRSLPLKKTVPFKKVIPKGDPQALELLGKMLCFDPNERLNVPSALEHPWLSSYHDPADEPDCPAKFEKWREIEELETMDEFRQALWKEIEDYRNEVRGLALDFEDEEEQPMEPALSASPPPMTEPDASLKEPSQPQSSVIFEEDIFKTSPKQVEAIEEQPEPTTLVDHDAAAEVNDKLSRLKEAEDILTDIMPSISPEALHHRRSVTMSTPTDPVVTYARRSSILQPSRQGSTYNSPLPGSYVPTFVEGSSTAGGDKLAGGSSVNMVPFPTQGYVVPARSRTGSTVGGEVTRRLLRTLSTVSIHEHSEGLAGGLAGIAPIGKYITEVNTEADAPPSEVPKDFGIVSDTEETEEQRPKKSEKRFVVG
ncbi:Pkinase-domain-containing protein [Pholiota conissans]|uniref:Mitogen-activated protein kinase n=1 Tax=Pholiota conissans TaxID=109636 RepID=A0A9P5Z890_9AGAR|nr:Pkinase-domain-containing protein [Pholiota conissans]